jgi:hypothetical protein
MGEAPCHYPFETLVGLAACLLFISISLPAKALSGEGSGNAAVTEDGTALSPFSPSNTTNGFGITETGPGDSDFPQSSAADSGSAKSQDSVPHPQAGAPTVSEGSHVAWGPLLGEALLFATMENARRVCCEIDTAPELKGVF